MHNEQKSLKGKSLAALAALGVVYGDIGTSPLYALKESFHHTNHLSLNENSIFGILSLIFWALIIVITIKYVFFILKADNKGEGGILALTNLVVTKNSKQIFLLLGLFGTALLYGDGMITPAISVLSAVEGLSLITPIFDPYIIPITVVILIGLFSIQRYGTAVVGKVFGPITLFWFITIALIGLSNILKYPTILSAINPQYAFAFFTENASKAFFVLGSVFLVITGGEALYSDLGHFGRKPIVHAWFIIVLPALILNYFGQGAFLLNNPDAIKNPFFLMAPAWSLTPLVILATFATVIASQALITGVFSLTLQAVQTNYISRVKIVHTSEHERGQIYIRFMNNFLMVSCVALVLVFKTSSNLASAYGIAVTTTMGITTILFYIYATAILNWNKILAIIICGFFLIIDLAFFGANIIKVLDGGWVPLVIAIAIFIIMTTWKKGRDLLQLRLAHKAAPLQEFVNKFSIDKPHRPKGTAIYLSSTLKQAPYALLNTYESFGVVHERLVFLSIETKETPFVRNNERIKIEKIAVNIYTIKVHFGYLESQNIPKAIDQLKLEEYVLNEKELIYFIGKERIFASNLIGMPIWREKLFSILNTNALDATTFFFLPPKRVIEIGIQVEI